jgi:uncharacterized protein (TIGR02001 family)
MFNRALLLATIPWAPLPAVAAQAPCAGVYVAATATSDYRFDGFSESDRSPTWQVTLHCYRTDGFYAGSVITGVDFEDTPRTRFEADFYAGKHIAIGRSDLNLELLYTSFPDKRAPGPSYGLLEAEAELSHSFGRLTLKQQLAFSPNDSGDTGAAWHVKETASYALTPWLTASGHLGRWMIARGVDRTHFDAGITAAWRRFTLDARWGGTDLKPAQCYDTDWCAPGAWVSLTWRAAP